MKFERILTIYWSKGFLYNGVLQPFTTPLPLLFKKIKGWSKHTSNLLLSRFEVYNLYLNPTQSTSPLLTNLYFSFNLFFSQHTSVNNRPQELQKYFLIKLLLIKTSRGRSHSLGKPSRGQRT